MITSKEEAESTLKVLLYNVRDLMVQKNEGGDVADFKTVIHLIESTIEPQSWDEVGGPGTIEPLRVQDEYFVVVDQTPDVHQQIEELLTSILRSVREISAARARPANKPRALHTRPSRAESRTYVGSPAWFMPALHE
ncbi:MAG: hypothetical protein AB7O62_10360 [Pirellulales bacterium]